MISALLFAAEASAAVDPTVISVFGSSVADGAYCGGNCSGTALNTSAPAGGCYQSRLREYQASASESTKRSVFNNCHGGDSTTKLLNRFDQMVATKAGIVFIGLSLANEGLRCCTPLMTPAKCKACHDEIFEHYSAGMTELVTKIRALGASPIIAGCYPNSDYTADEYVYIQRMNLLTQSWDVPNINFLGAIDDGFGRWTEGYHANGGHPNDLGSTEMYHTIVPTIFDAIAAGKPNLVPRSTSGGCVTFNGTSDPAVGVEVVIPTAHTMHSFTLRFDFRTSTAIDAAIAIIDATTIPVPTPAPAKCGDYCSKNGYLPDVCNCGVCGSFGGCSFSCTAGAGREKCPPPPPTPAPTPPPPASPVQRALVISKDGTLVYAPSTVLVNTDGTSGPKVNDGKWHTVTLTHHSCNASTSLYVDNAFVSTNAAAGIERLSITAMHLQAGKIVPSFVDFKELIIYRSGLAALELEFLDTNTTSVLQSSLEVYAPLVAGAKLADNYAQSMQTISVHLKEEEEMEEELAWEACDVAKGQAATSCPSASQCCKSEFSGSLMGCCPWKDAVCCKNSLTCCPKGTRCSDFVPTSWPGWGLVTTCVPSTAAASESSWTTPAVGTASGTGAGTAIVANVTGKCVCKPGPPLQPSTTLKNVLIIGDSVSIGYTPFIAKAMSAVALVQHAPYGGDGGAEETAYGVQCLDYFLRSPTGVPAKADVVMFVRTHD